MPKHKQVVRPHSAHTLASLRQICLLCFAFIIRYIKWSCCGLVSVLPPTRGRGANLGVGEPNLSSVSRSRKFCEHPKATSSKVKMLNKCCKSTRAFCGSVVRQLDRISQCRLIYMTSAVGNRSIHAITTPTRHADRYKIYVVGFLISQPVFFAHITSYHTHTGLGLTLWGWARLPSYFGFLRRPSKQVYIFLYRFIANIHFLQFCFLFFFFTLYKLLEKNSAVRFPRRKSLT